MRHPHTSIVYLSQPDLDCQLLPSLQSHGPRRSSLVTCIKWPAIKCSNRRNRPSIRPFGTALCPPLWRAEVLAETPPSCTSPAGVHPLGGDATCGAVPDKRVSSLGSRRQPPASRGIGIPLGRCLLHNQVHLTRNAPRPHPCPVGWPLVGLLAAVADMGAAGGREREELPALVRAAAAAASGRASGGRARRAGSRSPYRDGGRGRRASGSRARGTAAQRLEGGADGSGGPGAWTSAKGQGGGRVRRRAQHVGRAAKGELRETPVVRSVATRLYSLRPGGSPKCGTIRRPPRRTLPAVAGGSGVGRKAGGYGRARRTAAWPAHPTARVAAARWSAGVRRGGGRATPVPADPATARGRWRGCRLDNNSIHIRRGARRCARGARGAEAHASKLSLVVVVHTTGRHQLLVEGGGRGGGRGVEEAKSGL